MEVLKPGSWVTIGDNVPATIDRVTVSQNGVTYEVVWWCDRERKSAWLSPYEIKPHDQSEFMPIGFIASPATNTHDKQGAAGPLSPLADEPG